ncbi:MAG: DUF971 domain-containing protein [Myxococcales bacterium]|nr:DUF971 domain-containing protein [Myxococcales bacterium]
MINETQHSMTPNSIQWLDGKRAVQIAWDDGLTVTFTTEYLRDSCPCAGCKGTHTSPPLSAAPTKRFNVLSDSEAKRARDGASIQRAFPIGNYAIGFLWNDGHKEGIFSFRYLREHAEKLSSQRNS